MPSNNLAILACAGSGKTSEIVQRAQAIASGKALLLTYTINNTEEIRSRFYERNGCVPPTADVSTWFSFLLKHFVRPYQRILKHARIAQMELIQGRSALKIARSNTDRYYFSSAGRIYSDKLAEFGLACDTATSGKVIKRLKSISRRIGRRPSAVHIRYE